MRIHAIQTGLVRVKQSQIDGRGHGLTRRLAPLIDSEWGPWIPTFAWAIEHPEGVILVDTGASAGLNNLPRWHPYFRYAVRFQIEQEQEAGPQLRALGIGKSDIKQIIMTHLHMDHDAGLHHFPDSKVLVDSTEIQQASGWLGRIRGYLPERWPKTFDPTPIGLTSEPYGPFARSKRLTTRGDLIAVGTPGHTPGHLSVIVEDGETAIFLAGDASYSESNMLEGRVDGVSPDEGVAAATLRAIRQFTAERSTIYLPTHDPEAGRRLAMRESSVGKPPAMT